MEDKLTTVLIPQNSYPQIQKALEMSNTPVLALGGNFSPSADSHLVAVQRDDDEPSTNPMNNSDYETQAINIQNKGKYFEKNVPRNALMLLYLVFLRL